MMFDTGLTRTQSHRINNKLTTKEREEEKMTHMFNRGRSKRSDSDGVASKLASSQGTDYSVKLSNPVDDDISDLPMTEEEINQEYENMLTQLGISGALRDSEMKKGLRNKYITLTNFKRTQNDSMTSESTPEVVIQNLRRENFSLKILQQIQIQLRTGPIQWVNTFILNDGITAISECLAHTNLLNNLKSREDEVKQAECIRCFRAILNTNVGMDTFLYDRDTVRNLALVLSSESIPARSQVLFLLAIICSWSDQGYMLVLDALNHYKLVKREKQRFEDIVNTLRETSSVEYRFHALLLFNSLLQSSPEEGTRYLLQKEFRKLGMMSIIQEFKNEMFQVSQLDTSTGTASSDDITSIDNEEEDFDSLQRQLMFFEEEMASDWDNVEIKIADDPVEISKLLHHQLAGHESHNHLINVLYDLMKFSGHGIEKNNYRENMSAGWKTLERIIHRCTQNVDDGEVEEINEKILELEDRIKTQQGQIQTLENDVIREKKSYQAQFERLTLDLDSAKESAANAERGAQKLQEELNLKIVNLEDDKKNLDEKIERLKKEIETLNELNKKLEQQSKQKASAPVTGPSLADVKLDPSFTGNEPLPEDVPGLQQYILKLVKKYSEEVKTHEEKIKVLNAEKTVYEKKLKGLRGVTQLSPIQSYVQDVLSGKPLPDFKASEPIRLTTTDATQSTNAGPPPPGPPQPPMMVNVPPPPPLMGGPPPPPPPMMGGPPPPPPMMGGPPPPPPMMGGPPPPPMMGGPPPPPMMGGPPGPPMMGGPPPFGMPMMGMGAGLPPLPSNKPTVATRQIHFDQVSKKDLKDTIFIKHKIAEKTSKFIEDLDLPALQEMFSIKKVDKTVVEEKPKSDKKQVISLLDGKRSYNISLQLGSLRGLSYEKIRESIIQLDESVINDGNIGIIQQIAPTQEEIETVMNHDDPTQELAEPDKFFRALNGVPNLQQRLEAWNFKLKFLSIVSNIRPDIENVTQTCNELKDSDKFLKLLGLILTVGNYLNGANRNKVAYGFRLKSLAKLNDTKSSDGKTSLLQYICKIAAAKHPEVMKFHEDLQHLRPSARVLLTAMEEDISNIKKGVDVVKNQITLATKANLENDQFVSVMENFYDNATNQLEIIETKYNEMKAALEEIATLYNEDKKDLLKDPSDWFKTILEFINLFQKAVEKNETQLKAEEKRRKQEEEKLKKEKMISERAKKQQDAMFQKKTTVKAESLSGGEITDGRGVLDAHAKGLRDGTLWKKKKNKRASLGKGDFKEALLNTINN